MKIQKKFLTAFFICLNLYLFCEEMSLLVKDAELGFPLEGVSLELTGSSAENQSFITDAVGMANIQFEEQDLPLSINAKIPGYTSKHFSLTSGDYETELLKQGMIREEKQLVLYMELAALIEGEEIVVEAKREVKEEQQSGVSIVRTSEEMKTIAQTGIIEDVMSAVSLLPGVGFKLGMNYEPTIRGGYPKEMCVTLDGIYTLHPFYWGGLASLLSPYMIDSVKLSTGIFSSRFGQGVSGMLETKTVEVSDERKLTVNISTISADVSAELPLNDHNDLFLYGHLTDLTAVKWSLLGLLSVMGGGTKEEKADNIKTTASWVKRMPHIYTAYGKWTYSPFPQLIVHTKGLAAYDGTEIDVRGESGINEFKPDLVEEISAYPPYSSIANVKYSSLQGFGGLDVSWLITEKLQLNGKASYTGYMEKNDMHLYSVNISYFAEYDESGKLIGVGEVYPSGGEDIFETQHDASHQVQGKLETTVQLNSIHALIFGADEVFQTSSLESSRTHQTIVYVPRESEEFPGIILTNSELGPVIKTAQTSPGNTILTSAAYALWNFGNDKSLISGEAGVRGEHYYLWNKAAGFEMNNYPSADPRAYVSITPLRNKGIIEELQFSLGSGLYSALSPAVKNIRKEHALLNPAIKPDTAWLSVAGTSIDFGGVKLSLEGYYKHYLSRIYTYEDRRDPLNIVYYSAGDGKGYTCGGDLMIEKKKEGFVDGYISYSFLYARFFNPAVPLYDTQSTDSGDPLGIWYYPSFHRFHTANYAVNFRFENDITFTIAGSVATGAPLKVKIDKSSSYRDEGYWDPSMDENLNIQIYSDTYRSIVKWPIDMRFSKAGTFKKNPDQTWEVYVALKNVMALMELNRQMNNLGIDNAEPTSGWVIGESPYKIDMGIVPIPSFGFKMNF